MPRGQCISRMLLILLLQSSMYSGDKIEGKVDVVFVLPYDPSGSTLDNIRQVWSKEVFDHVEMGKVTKAAVVIVDKSDTIVPTPLTNDQNVLKSAIENTKNMAGGTPTPAVIFQKIRTIFNSTSKDRAKVVIAFSVKWPSGNDAVQAAKKEAQLLRETGVILYMVNPIADAAASRAAKAYTTWNTFGLNSIEFFTKNAVQKIQQIVDVMIIDLCTMCSYQDAKPASCKSTSRRSGSKVDYFGDNNARCKAKKPRESLACTEQRCDEECDRQWPWDGIADCSKLKCGSSIKRKPVSPAPAQMQHCKSKFECKCADNNLPIIIGSSIGVVLFLIVVVIIVVVIVLTMKNKSNVKKSQKQKKMKKKAQPGIYVDLTRLDEVSAGSMTASAVDAGVGSKIMEGGSKMVEGGSKMVEGGSRMVGSTRDGQSAYAAKSAVKSRSVTSSKKRRR